MRAASFACLCLGARGSNATVTVILDVGKEDLGLETWLAQRSDLSNTVTTV